MGFQHIEPERLRTLARTNGMKRRALSESQVKRLRECTDGTSDQAFADLFSVDIQTIFAARVGNSYKDHPSAPRRIYTKRPRS
jgi:hypothetical protein